MKYTSEFIHSGSKSKYLIHLHLPVYLSYGQRVGQEVGPVLVGVGLAEPGQREGEAGGEQEHRVHHRQQDHQSTRSGYYMSVVTIITCRMSSDA